MGSYLGAIDQGTTSTRFIIFDRSGRIVACEQREHEQIYPRPGWVEHDAEEIWRRTREVIAAALEQRALAASDLAAVGITNQRETTVLWDRKTGKPVHNAIVWQDTRVADDVAAFARQGGQDRFRLQTGLPLTTYFSGLKIRWILENVPGVRQRAESGELLFGTDGRLSAVATHRRSEGWDSRDGCDQCEPHAAHESAEFGLGFGSSSAAFDIPRSLLPEIRSSSEIYGVSTEGALRGVRIAGILGDQQAALVGQTCFRPGEAKNTYGTGCFLLMNVGEKPVRLQHGLLTTVAYRFGKQPVRYALEGSIAITGALVQWLRDNLGLIEKSSDIEALAISVSDNGGVYFVPAFSGLYAPYWKDSARGVITGLTRFANKGHLARAVLEATAFQTREVLEAMEKDSGIGLDSLRTDGGMVGNNLLMQMQANILNRPVVRPIIQETTALGAAYAAGLGVGFYQSEDELRANWAVDHTWTPNLDREAEG